MMKRLLFTICTLLITLSLNAQHKFTLIGHDIPIDGYLTLKYKDGNFNEVNDTIALTSKKGIRLIGEIAEPATATIQVLNLNNRQLVYHTFFLCPGVNLITTVDTLKRSAHVEGGPEQMVFLQRKNWIEEERNRFEGGQLNKLRQEIQKLRKDEVPDSLLQPKQTEYNRLMKEWEKKDEQLHLQFIRENPNTLVSVHSINYLVGYVDDSILQEHYDLLDPTIKESKAGKFINGYLIAKVQTALGVKAPAFSQADVEGNQISLSDYSGKYVLLDFWASWCIPCRKEHPNMVKTYHTFKSKGFDILGISLDSDKENWTKAIAEDSLEWAQVSDLRGWQNEVSTKYGIYSIPQNILLDPDGNIIAKNLKGQALFDKLDELFEKQTR